MTNQSPSPNIQTISVIARGFAPKQSIRMDRHVMSTLLAMTGTIKFIQTLFIVILLVISYSSFAISPAFAQERGGVDKEGRAGGDIVGTINPPQTVIGTIGDTGNFISAIVRFITVIAGLYALWQFITGGLGFITSGGDKGKIQTATSQIMMAITGLVVIGMSFILASIIGRLLFGAGFNLLSPTLQSVQ